MAAILYPPHITHLAIIRSWDLTPEQIEDCSNHYLLRWKTQTVLKALVDTNTPLIHDSIPYLPIFFKCLPLDLIHYSDLFLSFRKHKNALNGYVLISPAYATKRSIKSS
jgi:hypothetical protein